MLTRRVNLPSKLIFVLHVDADKEHKLVRRTTYPRISTSLSMQRRKASSCQ